MDRRAFLRAGAVGIAGMLLAPPAFSQMRTVTLLPLLVENDGVRWRYPRLGNLAQELSAIYRIDTSVADPLSLATGRDASDVLRAVGSAGYAHAIGITGAPLIWAPGNSKPGGVSGLAHAPGRAAIVTDYWRKSESAEVTHRRLLDVTAHEFGHNLGARDCDDYGCSMYNDPTAKRRRLDALIGVYCDAHRELLKDWLY